MPGLCVGIIIPWVWMWLFGSKMSFNSANTVPNPGSSTALVSFQGNKGVIILWFLPEGKKGEGRGDLSNSWVKFGAVGGFYTLSFPQVGVSWSQGWWHGWDTWESRVAPGWHLGGTCSSPTSWISVFPTAGNSASSQNQSAVSLMCDSVKENSTCWPQHLSSYPDVTTAGFSHLMCIHFQTQHFIFLLFPGSQQGFPPSQGPGSNKLPCSIMGMLNLDWSSSNLLP